MHEAFAAQTLANLKMFAGAEFARDKLGRSAIGEVDMDKFNVLGGSLAFGHPLPPPGRAHDHPDPANCGAGAGLRLHHRLCGGWGWVWPWCWRWNDERQDFSSDIRKDGIGILTMDAR